jgi:hypothetical protein
MEDWEAGRVPATKSEPQLKLLASNLLRKMVVAWVYVYESVHA